MKRFLSTATISLLMSALMVGVYHYAVLVPQVENASKMVSGDLIPSAEKDRISSVLTNFSTDPTGENIASSLNNIPDFRLAAQMTMPAVVHIKSNKTYGARQSTSVWDRFFDYGRPGNGGSQTVSTGSGVIISSDGYIVTNNHVIENADELEVTLFDNRSFKAKVIGTYPLTDLGVIKIEGLDLPAIELADSDDATVGEWVLAVGNPFNLSSTATAGIVSAIGRDLDIIKTNGLDAGMPIESFIQTDAAVNPGNSGGALVNLDGKLLGINTAIASPTGAYAGYAFAVPANIVRKVVEDLIEFGKVQRAFIGISEDGMKNLNSTLAREFDLDRSEGVLITELNSEGAAAKAGIRPRDVITSIDGVQVKNSAKLLEMVARNRPGDAINVLVSRKGSIKGFDVILTDVYGNTQFEAEARSTILTDLGVEFLDIDPEKLRRYGFEHGVLVSKLVAGKIREQTEMQKGFVIIKVNGEDVGNVGSLTRQLERSRGRIHFKGFYPGDRYYSNYEIDLSL